MWKNDNTENMITNILIIPKVSGSTPATNSNTSVFCNTKFSNSVSASHSGASRLRTSK